MEYKVLEDLELDYGKAEPVAVKAGSTFIPAETNYPRDKVEALVRAGKLELIKHTPPGGAHSSKRK